MDFIKCMIPRKKKICKGCGNEKYIFGKGLCDYCYNLQFSKPIKKVSEKRNKENEIYFAKRKIFLSRKENIICPITGEKTTEIHHIKKRIGFADDWAKENNINLLLDERFWLAVSRKGHIWIHDNINEAKKLGYLK